jgi:hypothetical protein
MVTIVDETEMRGLSYRYTSTDRTSNILHGVLIQSKLFSPEEAFATRIIYFITRSSRIIDSIEETCAIFMNFEAIWSERRISGLEIFWTRPRRSSEMKNIICSTILRPMIAKLG